MTVWDWCQDGALCLFGGQAVGCGPAAATVATAAASDSVLVAVLARFPRAWAMAAVGTATHACLLVSFFSAGMKVLLAFASSVPCGPFKVPFRWGRFVGGDSGAWKKYHTGSFSGISFSILRIYSTAGGSWVCGKFRRALPE